MGAWRWNLLHALLYLWMQSKTTLLPRTSLICEGERGGERCANDGAGQSDVGAGSASFDTTQSCTPTATDIPKYTRSSSLSFRKPLARRFLPFVWQILLLLLHNLSPFTLESPLSLCLKPHLLGDNTLNTTTQPHVLTNLSSIFYSPLNSELPRVVTNFRTDVKTPTIFFLPPPHSTPRASVNAFAGAEQRVKTVAERSFPDRSLFVFDRVSFQASGISSHIPLHPLNYDSTGGGGYWAGGEGGERP